MTMAIRTPPVRRLLFAFRTAQNTGIAWRRIRESTLMLKVLPDCFLRPSIKTRNMEHSGTSRKVPEYPGTWISTIITISKNTFKEKSKNFEITSQKSSKKNCRKKKEKKKRK